MNDKLGLVHVYTGPGPGKTTRALGLALRCMGHDYKTYIIQFLKGRWRGEKEFGETKIAKKLKGLQITRFGTGKLIPKGEKPGEIDKKLAKEGLRHAEEIVNSKIQTLGGETHPKYQLVILDEINVALHFGLIETDEVLDLIKNKPEGVELVLTGRKAPKKIKERADYLLIFKDKKHPYDKGIDARKGIEY